QRPELEAAKEDLGQFGLQLDAAGRGIGVETFIDQSTVDVCLDVPSFADHVEAIPLAVRAFDILFAAKTEFVLPVGVAAVPVDALPVFEVERLALSSFFPDYLAVAVANDFARQRNRNRLALLVVPGD